MKKVDAPQGAVRFPPLHQIFRRLAGSQYVVVKADANGMLLSETWACSWVRPRFVLTDAVDETTRPEI